MFRPAEANTDFSKMEKKWLKYWYEKGIVAKYLKKNSKSKKYFSFLDGPITANNPMGVHHAWGRTYKDLWPRFYNLLGYNQRFQNGFDCQGLWVEVEVEKELGLKGKKEIENLVAGDKKKSIAKFVELCKQRVHKYAKIQTEQSKRLGYFADWDNSYYTMSEANNYMIWHFLRVCHENGWIYKGRESVPWCPRCETAISQHEMLTEDYKEVVHESIYFKLPVSKYQLPNNPQFSNKTFQKSYLLVWTTTPWTLPANIAVAVDKKIDYALVETDKGPLWVAKEAVMRALKLKDQKVIKVVKGKELAGLKYEGPFDDLPAVKQAAEESESFHTVVATDQNILPINVTEGTGMVHTAVSAGTEDFKLGKKLGLPMIPVIADNADYLAGLGFLTGKNAKKNPRVILDHLLEKDKKGEHWVYDIHNYKHRYPACWRCKKELVWKVEDEWYVAMDVRPLRTQNSKLKAQSLTLRQRMINVAKKIKWLPEFGLDRELDWLRNMHDWLISKKNRYWGLALPIYECKNCGCFEVIGSKLELKNRAVKGWKEFEGRSPHKPFIDEVEIECKQCGSNVKRIEDVGNPWLDAGIVGYSTVSEDNRGEPLYLQDKKKWSNWFPADFITESFPGQFKNWFYALIAESAVLENTTQFKTVLGFGTMLDEKGKAFHKSAGNAIEFVEGADKFGADIIRWVCGSHNPADNILFGEHKVKEVVRRFYLMLWNVYKFFIEYANLDKFVPKNPQGSGNPEGSENVLDKWILSRFGYLVLFVEKSLREYNAKDAALEIEKFVNDLSTWYIRRSRDRVWVNSDDNIDKQNFYQTLHYILVNLSITLSPFMPFISEEIYTNLTGRESVHLESWPEISKSDISKPVEQQMLLARNAVEAGHAKRKEIKVKVRIPLAKLEVEAEGEFSHLGDMIWELVLAELNVKNITVNRKTEYPKDEVKVREEDLKHEGELRELIRQIQIQRKKLGLNPGDQISLTVPNKFLPDKDLLSKKLLAKKIAFAEKTTVEA
ncbi:isoleucine--tRNA ligase [Candidatus Roizmanbacteria bacterium RIFCSPLOWO2_01_FULL_40_13]|nr:MAG: isoleucine--tRNA ligase [Candidatus Roizmanbacteria bacterium RIFCSPLOWO2_01_FULL_40_13]